MQSASRAQLNELVSTAPLLVGGDNEPMTLKVCCATTMQQPMPLVGIID
jgi:hypothetical protein